MKIGIANDHHGISLKKKIINHLKQKNIEYVNYGTDEENNIDYVDYAVTLCNGLNSKEVDLGVLICGTGIGMSVVANKIDGIICGKVNTIEEAKLAKEHNCANVIAVGEKVENIEKIVDIFIETKNSTEERHIRRVSKIKDLENK